MATVLEAIATYVDSNSALTAGTNLFGGHMPDLPNTAVCLYEYDGAEPSYVMGSGSTVDKPRIQLLSRGAAGQGSYAAARDQAQTLRALLDLTNTTLSGIYVIRLHPLGSLNPIGKDEKERHQVTVSFECEHVR